MSLSLPPRLGSALSSDDLPGLIGEMYPPLARYCPLLPLVSKQQALWLLLENREAFYGGAAGGGKSAALLMAALQFVDTPGYAALVLRRTFPQLSQPGMLIPLSKEWFGPHPEVRWNEQAKEWTFPSGAIIRFGHLNDDNAVFNYQGGAYQFIGFDELTQFTPAMYEYVAFSRVRRRLDLEAAGVPNRVRATANPGGVGHAWVKSRFVDEATKKPGVVFIPAKVQDNPGLDVADYAESLSHLGEILRAQLLDGDWGAFEGAAYPMFRDEVHSVDAFDVPLWWERFESMDWGSTNPCAWHAWAVDNDGNVVCFDELYVEEPQPHLPDDIAPLVLEVRKAWHPEGERPVVHADPSVFDGKGITNRWGEPANVADEFQHLGIDLSPANRDRQAGYVRIAQLLRVDDTRPFPAWHPRAGELGAPKLFVFKRCVALREQLQGAPLEAENEPYPGEAVSRKWEGPYGHAHASARYGLMSWAAPAEEPPAEEEDPRVELLRRVEQQRQQALERRRSSFAM